MGIAFHRDPTKGTQYTPQVGGGAGRNVNYQVDGGDNNDDTVGGQLQMFPLDAIEEFRFSLASYGADTGRNSGGVMNVVTRSGTNRLSGSAFVFFRDDGLNARFGVGSWELGVLRILVTVCFWRPRPNRLRGSREPAVGHLKDQKLGGHLNSVRVVQRDPPVHRPVAEKRAVLAPEILERCQAVFQSDLRVMSRDAGDIQPDRRIRIAPNHVDAVVGRGTFAFRRPASGGGPARSVRPPSTPQKRIPLDAPCECVPRRGRRVERDAVPSPVQTA